MGRRSPGVEIPGPARQVGVGVVAPFDFALDRELWRWAPDDVTLLVTRTPFVPHPVGIELAIEVSVDDHVRDAARSLAVVEPEVVAYACTSGSFVGGQAGERRLRTVLREGGAPRAVTTSGALLDALVALGAGRVALATPYVREVNVELESFLAEAGVATASSECLGLESHIWQVDYAATCELVLAADRPDADAVFVSCTNLPTYDLIAPMEAALGKPVLTANQVTIWGALGALGRSGNEPSRFLTEAPIRPAPDAFDRPDEQELLCDPN